MSSYENETAILSLSRLIKIKKKNGDFCTKHSLWVHPILLNRYSTSLETAAPSTRVYKNAQKCLIAKGKFISVWKLCLENPIFTTFTVCEARSALFKRMTIAVKITRL